MVNIVIYNPTFLHSSNENIEFICIFKFIDNKIKLHFILPLKLKL
jgi:hypothetical protein